VAGVELVLGFVVGLRSLPLAVVWQDSGARCCWARCGMRQRSDRADASRVTPPRPFHKLINS
jgi:hypothetical protein